LPVSSQAVQDKIETLLAFQLGGVAIDENSEATRSVPVGSVGPTDEQHLLLLALVEVPT
jgi:hypothetical protein